MTAPASAEHPSAVAVRAAPAPPKAQNRLAQLSTLIRRYLAVIASDRNYVGVIALLPIILGALIRAIPDPCLIGVANAVRELVKERPIYNRERAAGLSPGAYLVSKLAVLAIASMTAGLLISAVVNSSDKTMPLLVVAVLAEVVLSGGVFRLNGMAGLGQLSWLSPSRWGFGAAASTANLNQVTPPPPGNTPDPLWQHSPHIWLFDMAMQLALTAVLAGFAWWRLRRASPGRRR